MKTVSQSTENWHITQTRIGRKQLNKGLDFSMFLCPFNSWGLKANHDTN